MLDGWPPPVLDPAGPYAGSITLLSWILLGMAGAVLLVVLVALYLALFGRPETRGKVGGPGVIWVGGVAFPLVVLSVLLV